MLDTPHPLTVTHARLRRAQGDAAGAIAILEALIDDGDESDALWELYEALGGDLQGPHAEPGSAPPAQRAPATASELTQGFRAALAGPSRAQKVQRLERFLNRVRASERTASRD